MQTSPIVIKMQLSERLAEQDMLDALRPFLVAENLVPAGDSPVGAAASAAAPVGTDVLKALARKWRLGRPEFWRSVAGSRLRLARALLVTALERAALPAALPASEATSRLAAGFAAKGTMGKPAAAAKPAATGFGSPGKRLAAQGLAPAGMTAASSKAVPSGMGCAAAAAAVSVSAPLPMASAALAEHGKRAKAGTLSRHLAAIDVAALIAEAKQQPKQQQRAARRRHRSASLPKRGLRATFGADDSLSVSVPQAASGFADVVWWDTAAAVQAAGFAPKDAHPSGVIAPVLTNATTRAQAVTGSSSRRTSAQAGSDDTSASSHSSSESGSASVVIMRHESDASKVAPQAATGVIGLTPASSRSASGSPTRPVGVPQLAVSSVTSRFGVAGGAAAAATRSLALAGESVVVAADSTTSSVTSSPVSTARGSPIASDHHDDHDGEATQSAVPAAGVPGKLQPRANQSALAHMQARLKGPGHRRSQSCPATSTSTSASTTQKEAPSYPAPSGGALTRTHVAGGRPSRLGGHVRASTHAHGSLPTPTPTIAAAAVEPQPAQAAAEVVLQKSLRQSCADAVRELARRPANRAAILAEEGALESLVTVMHDSDSFDTKMAVAVTLAALSSVQAPLASQLALLEGPHVAAALDALAVETAQAAAKTAATATATAMATATASSSESAAIAHVGGGDGNGSPSVHSRMNASSAGSASPVRPASAMAASPAGTGMRLAAADAAAQDVRPSTAGSPSGVSAAGFGSSATLRRRGISLSLALDGSTAASGAAGGAGITSVTSGTASPSGAGAAVAATRALATATGLAIPNPSPGRSGHAHRAAHSGAASGGGAVHGAVDGFELPSSVLPALADLAHRVCSADAAAHAANAALTALGGAAAAAAASASTAASASASRSRQASAGSTIRGVSGVGTDTSGTSANGARSSIDAVLARHATAWVDPLGRASLRCVVATTLYNLTCDKRLVRRFASDATAVDALLTLMEPGSPALLASAADEAREGSGTAGTPDAAAAAAVAAASSVASSGCASPSPFASASPLGSTSPSPSPLARALRSPLARLSSAPSPLSPGASFGAGGGGAGTGTAATTSTSAAAGGPQAQAGTFPGPGLSAASLAELDAVISADAYVMALCVRALANVAAAPPANSASASSSSESTMAMASESESAVATPSAEPPLARPLESPTTASSAGATSSGAAGIGPGAALLQQAGVARALAGVFNWLSPALRVVVAAHVLEPMTRSQAAAQQLAADGGVVLLRSAMRCLYEAHLKRKQQKERHAQKKHSAGVGPATSAVEAAVEAAATAAAGAAKQHDAAASTGFTIADVPSGSGSMQIDAEGASSSLDALSDDTLQWACRRVLFALSRMAVTRQGIVKVLRGLGTVALAEGVEMVLDHEHHHDDHDHDDAAADASSAADASAASALPLKPQLQPSFASVAVGAYMHVRQLVRGSNWKPHSQSSEPQPDIAALFQSAELWPTGLPAWWAEEARAAVLAATTAVATGGTAHSGPGPGAGPGAGPGLALSPAAGSGGASTAVALERGASFNAGARGGASASVAVEGFSPASPASSAAAAHGIGASAMSMPSARLQTAAVDPSQQQQQHQQQLHQGQQPQAASEATPSEGLAGSLSVQQAHGSGPCSLSRARVLRSAADALQRLLSSPKAGLAAAGGAAGAAAMMLCTAGTRDAVLAKSCLHSLVLAFHAPECAEYASFDGAALAALHFVGFLARLQLAALQSDGRVAAASSVEAAAAALLPHSPATAAALLSLQPLAMLALFNATAHASVAQRLMAAPGQIVGAHAIDSVSSCGSHAQASHSAWQLELTRLIPSLARRIRVRDGTLRLPTGLGDSDRDGIAAAGANAIHALLTSGSRLASAVVPPAEGTLSIAHSAPEVVAKAEAGIAAGRSSLSAHTEGQLQSDPYGGDAALSTAAALMSVAEGRSAGAAGSSAAVSTILAILALNVSQLREAQRHAEAALQQQMDAFARVQAITSNATSTSTGTGSSGSSDGSAVGTGSVGSSALAGGIGVGVHVNGSSVALQPQMPAGLVAALGLLPSGSPAPCLHSHLYRLVAFALGE